MTPIRSGKSCAMSTNSPAWILLTSFRGTGGRPAPMNRTGGRVAAPLSSFAFEGSLPLSVATWDKSPLLGSCPTAAYLDRACSIIYTYISHKYS